MNTVRRNELEKRYIFHLSTNKIEVPGIFHIEINRKAESKADKLWFFECIT